MPRSLLFVPASKPRMLAKLPTLPADLCVVDLEDGVPTDAKGAARENLLASAPAEGARWTLRVNAVGSRWHADDVALAGRLRAPGVVLSKAEDPVAVMELARRVSGWGGRLGLMIETPRGLEQVERLAAVDGVDRLLYGSADMRAALGARSDPERGWERPVLMRILVTARSRGLYAIDSVYFHFRDDDGLVGDAAIAREMGFDGKSCIHPGQVETIHRVYRPTDDELRWAEGVLRGWDEQQGDRAGVVVLDGEMIEGLHVDLARRILARRT